MAEKSSEPKPWDSLPGETSRQRREAWFALPPNERPGMDPAKVGSANKTAPNLKKDKGEIKPRHKPQGPRAQGSYAGAVAGGVPRFSPGSYPVVFSASVGEPVAQVFFGVDTAEVARQSETVLRDLERDPKMVQYTYQLRTNAERESFSRSFRASGVLAAAQSLVLAHVNAKFPMGNFSALNGASLTHTRSMRTVMSQYGDFSHADSGMRVTPYGYQGEVRRLIRMARQMLDHPDQAGNRSWLPTEIRDRAFLWTLASRLVKLLKKQTGTVVPVSEVADQVYTPGLENASWFKVFLASFEADRQGRWSWLFGAFPATMAEFLAFAESVEGKWALEQLELEWLNPAVDHLQWALVPNTLVSEVLTAWGAFSTMVENNFHVSSKADFQSGAVGSMMQLAHVSEPVSGIVLVQMVMACLPSAMSLATSFPPSSVWDETSHPPLATLSGTVLLSETRQRWVQTDLKG